MLTACFSVMVQLLLLLIRIAMKLRLSIPLVYLVLMLTAFRPWYRVHATLADGIFLVMFYYCFLLDKYCLSCLNQGNFASVDMTKFNKFLFAVPSIEDQNHIVAQLDRFNALCNDLTSGLPAEIAARQKQYEYYRDKLLTFKERETN